MALLHVWLSTMQLGSWGRSCSEYRIFQAVEQYFDLPGGENEQACVLCNLVQAGVESAEVLINLWYEENLQ